ncbi:hypothetical protein IMCC26256_111809 [Actinobacteria bacterium IMCC26256]|nr:hypothetical protein IMCC26256_111809 [Actinobacteria bacterium IMCC26256]
MGVDVGALGPRADLGRGPTSVVAEQWGREAVRGDDAARLAQ